MTLNEIIKRIGYIRNKANMSARELSLSIDKTPSYINKLETSGFNLTVQTLLDIIESCNFTTENFFYEDIETYLVDKEILMLLKNINIEKKKAIISILQN